MKQLILSSILLSSICLSNSTKAQPTFTKVGDVKKIIINSKVNNSYRLNNSGIALEFEPYGKRINFTYFNTSGYKVEIPAFELNTFYYADASFFYLIKTNGYQKQSYFSYRKI